MKIGEAGRHILTLSAGSVVAQLIPIVASLVLARLYSAESYGDWGIFLSFATMFAVVATGQYEMAIVRPESDRDAEMVVRLCFLIECGFFLLSFLGLAIGEWLHIAFITNIPCRFLLPFFVFSLGLLQIYTHYANRKEQYKVIAFQGVARNATQASMRILLGLLKQFTGLITGAFCGLLAALVYSETNIPLRQVLRRGYDWAAIRTVAIRYRYFPMYQLPGSLLNAASTSVLVLLLALYFEKEYIGYFSMTLSLLYFPVQLAGAAMSKVFYKKASQTASQEQTHRLMMQLLGITFGVGLVMNLLLIGGGEDLFAFFLGERWRISGQYALVLAPWIWITLCFNPFSVIFDAKDQQKKEMIINLVMFGSRVVLILICGELLQPMLTTILCYGIVGLLLWIVEAYWIVKLAEVKFNYKQIACILPAVLLMLLSWGYKVYLLF